MSKTALVTGISGMDGSYLSELLLSKGYEVWGLVRRNSSSESHSRLEHLKDDINLVYGDITDKASLYKIISESKPDEIYNLAAMSHVGLSFKMPEYTFDADAKGVLNVLEVMKDLVPKAKMYQACHDIDTKVVSEKGIVDYKCINVGDMVYTFNVITRKMELKKVKKIHEYDYNDDMVCINGQRTDQKVTPNHKLLLKMDDGNIEYIDADQVSKLLPYKRTSGVSLVVPSPDFNYDSYDVYLSSMVDFSSKSKNHVNNLIDKMQIEDLLYLVGIYIGDGWVKKNKKALVCEDINTFRDECGKFTHKEGRSVEVEYDSCYIQFAVPKTDPERSRIIEIFNKYNMVYTEQDITISFSSFPLAKIFKTCGQGYSEKHIPGWAWDHSYLGLLSLKNGLIGSDGHVRKLNGRESFSTSSSKLLKDMIVLSYHLGIHCSYSTRKPINMYFEKQDRFIKSNSDGYIVSLNQKPNNKIYRDTITTEHYKGKVWCLEMEGNSNFMIARNGKVCFSGNSTSELFGISPAPQDESTPFHPRSPYGVAKLAGYWSVVNYRESYDMFCCNGILFNHESVRRGDNFVTKKITKAVAGISLGKQSHIELGNLDAKRDWGHAKDYVEAMYLMLQQDTPEDFVIATGITYTVRDFLQFSFDAVGIKVESNGAEGVDEEWVDVVTEEVVVKINPEFYRPAEVHNLCGNPKKAKDILNWEATTKLKDLVKEMVEYDIEMEKR